MFYLNHMYRTLWGATTPGLSGPWNDSNKGVLSIPQSSSITGASPTGCLVSNPGHSLGKSYPSTEKHSMYPTVPADWATRWGSLTPEQRSSRCIVQSLPTGPNSQGLRNNNYHDYLFSHSYMVCLNFWETHGRTQGEKI